MLSVTDLSTFGLGCDIGGGYLAARGLLGSPGQLARLTATYWGANRAATVAAAFDGVAARFGLGALGLGFAVQAVAYTLTAGGVAPAAASTTRAVVSFLVAVIAVLGVLLAERLCRRRLVMRTLIAAARWDTRTGTTLADPSGAALAGYGQELGEPPRAGESHDAYALRVWGTSRTAD